MRDSSPKQSFQICYTPMGNSRNILKMSVATTTLQLVEVKSPNFGITKTWHYISDLPLVSCMNLFISLSLSFLTSKMGIIPTFVEVL